MSDTPRTDKYMARIKAGKSGPSTTIDLLLMWAGGLEREITALEAKVSERDRVNVKLFAAYMAASAFIRAHVADPYITEEMRQTYSDWLRLDADLWNAAPQENRPDALRQEGANVTPAVAAPSCGR
jgi:hypothetical protein